MRRVTLLCAAVFLFTTSSAIAGTWTTLDYTYDDIKQWTWITGIDGDNLVGNDGWSNSFLYNGTSWENLNYPGASRTLVFGISGNNIVGHYGDNLGYHGFSYDGSAYATIDYPGASETGINGIDGGNLVGVYVDSSGNARGFLYNGADFTPLDMPGAVQTWISGINGITLVGCYADTSGPPTSEHGFLYDITSGVWTPLDMPGAADWTQIRGIDGMNLVGSYVDSSHYGHGFLYNRITQTWTTLDYPGAVYTEALGIEGNKVVGVYETVESGVLSGGPMFHGFVYEISEPVNPCTTPPDFELSVTPNVLWPPNHKMVKITPTLTVTDICDPSPKVSLVGMTCNDKNAANDDIQIAKDGSIYLRAEKDRIYTITYKACDKSGNCTTRSSTVVVPHDKGH